MQSSMQKSGFSANELLRCLGILSGRFLTESHTDNQPGCAVRAAALL